MVDIAELDQIKKRIESMNKLHHIEILRILKKNPNVKLNENKNGVFVNLSFLPEDLVEEMRAYISYVTEQEKTIKNFETQQEEFKKNISAIDEISYFS